jgi:hypothetical protein
MQMRWSICFVQSLAEVRQMTHDHPSTEQDGGTAFTRLLSWCVVNSKTVVIALAAVSGALLVGDFFYEKHGHFAFEEWFGFYPVFGFVVYVTVVMLAKKLRGLIKRPEDYYGETSIDAEDGLPAADDGKQNHDGGGHA